MKYVDEYRDQGKAQKIAGLINGFVGARRYKIMEVCGTHTAAIRKFGLKSLISEKIELISGPGCPVCVTSEGYLKNVVALLKKDNILIATYSDMLRVPIDKSSLEIERSKGAQVRAVTSVLEALDFARRDKAKEVVFLGVGFETTAPGTAIALEMVKREKINNFSVYSSHKTIPNALAVLAEDRKLKLDGFLLPGHVSAIIGLNGYKGIRSKTKVASVIAGFEALDILLAVYEIIKAVNAGQSILKNEYTRIVSTNGNVKAQKLLKRVFEEEDAFWRGLGLIKKTGLGIAPAFEAWDAQKKFCLKKETGALNFSGGCKCADVLKGLIKPNECPFFGKACNPESPKGPCMVSREGTCRSYFEYR